MILWSNCIKIQQCHTILYIILYNTVLHIDSAFAAAVGPNQEAGMKILYRALPTPFLKVKAISSILNRASLAPCFLMGSDFPTIPTSIRGMGARFDHGKADVQGQPGTGSELFEVNMWAMRFARPKPRQYSVREADERRSAVREQAAASRGATLSRRVLQK